MVNVLRRLGVHVDFPEGQTCCGQPAFNSGYPDQAAPLAKRFVDLFEQSDYVVTPSGSCGSMLKLFTPNLLQDQPDLAEKARSVSSRVFEFSQFLVNVLNVTDVGARFEGKITYHASCHLLRELGVITEPRVLLQNVANAQFVEMGNATECCGFGGTFSVKYPEISNAIMETKLLAIEATDADVLVACDSGCLMQLGGAMSRRGMKARAVHLAQLLDGIDST